MKKAYLIYEHIAKAPQANAIAQVGLLIDNDY